MSLLRRMRRNRLCVFGGTVTLAFLVGGLVGAVMLAVPSLHHLYLQEDLINSLAPPGSHGLLGTDNLGRSLLARSLVGLAISIGVGIVVTTFSVVAGGITGLSAGYYGGRLDQVVSGVIDVTWGFPIILVAVVLAGVFLPGLTVVILAIALINWAGFARVLRGEALSLRERDFVKSARALGVPNLRIIRDHLVPNVIAPTLVLASYYLAITIIAEAGLSFIGVGVQPPTPSLGVMIADGRDYWTVDAWVVVIPGILLAVLVIGLNALGDGLRDVLDPRLRERG